MKNYRSKTSVDKTLAEVKAFLDQSGQNQADEP